MLGLVGQHYLASVRMRGSRDLAANGSGSGPFRHSSSVSRGYPYDIAFSIRPTIVDGRITIASLISMIGDVGEVKLYLQDGRMGRSNVLIACEPRHGIYPPGAPQADPAGPAGLGLGSTPTRAGAVDSATTITHAAPSPHTCWDLPSGSRLQVGAVKLVDLIPQGHEHLRILQVARFGEVGHRHRL